MKSIQRILVSLLLISASLSDIFGQSNLVISGGNIVSSLVCANKQVYVWGSNAGGISGTGDPAAILTVPTKVTGFGGLDIKQVNSGSGAHFVALDCMNGVWAWGNNSKGQIGDGVAGGNVTVPTRVKAGVLNGMTFVDPVDGSTKPYADASGNLVGGVSVVYAGNQNSYAILQDGRLISWGANSDGTDMTNHGDFATGQLGDGTTTDRTTPVFVKDGAGNPLTGVTQVFAGDNVAYALVDPDGDGVGTVYSWGYGQNGTLGRNATGTANPASSALVQSSFAYPVIIGPGAKQLSNITNIAAGDVFGMALDLDGHIWTWGNGAWNNATGNTLVNYAGSDPRKVLGGTTTADDQDGAGFLLALAIGGGQGYGMAITINNRPVAWGGTGTTTMCADGGLTGTGVTTAKAPVSYIQRTGGIVDDNVSIINRGDTWGFYGTTDNKFYAWGCNIVGQLGIGAGNTTNQAFAVPIIPPNTCDFKDPKPFAKLTPKDTTVCGSQLTAANPIILKSGFQISATPAALQTSYQIRWYKDNVLVAGPAESITADGTGNGITGATYKATDKGEYKVTVSYVGTNGDCGGYKVAKDSMTIKFYLQNFTIPSNLDYCGSILNPYVIGGGKYAWYAAKTGGSPLDTTVKSGKASIPFASTDGSGSVWVEELGDTISNVVDTTSTFSTKDPSNVPNNMMFVAYQRMSIDTISISLQGQTSALPANYSWQFKVYGSKLSCSSNGSVSDITNVIKSGVTTVIPAFIASTSQYKIIKIPVNITVPGTPAGTRYWIGLTPTSGPQSGSNVSIKYFTNAPGHAYTTNDPINNTPSQDKTTNGNIVDVYGTDQKNGCVGGTGDLGSYFNWQVSTAPKFCDRIKVTLTENCPCNKPTLVNITNTDSTKCLGDTLTLHGEYTNAGKNLTNPNMYYVWYKKGNAPSAAGAYSVLLPKPVFGDLGTHPTGSDPIAAPSPAKLIASQTGVYYLRVQDGNIPGQTSCYTEDSIIVTVAKFPARPTFTGDSTLCVGENLDLTAKSASVTGVTLKTPAFTWKDDGTGAATSGAVGTDREEMKKTAVALTDAVTYRVVVESTDGCKDSSKVKLVVSASPTRPIFSKDTVLCLGAKLDVSATSAAVAGVTVSKFIWTFPTTTVAPRADTIGATNNELLKANVAYLDSSRYKVVVVSTTGCKDSSTVGIHVKGAPTKPTFKDTIVCEGKPLKASVTNATATVKTYTWNKPVGSNAAAGTPTQFTTLEANPVALKDSGDYNVVAQSIYGCKDSATVHIKVFAKPLAPFAGKDTSICAVNYSLDADNLTIGKGVWSVVSVSSGPVSAISFNDKHDPKATVSGIPQGSAGTPVNLVLNWTVGNGTCDSLSDQVTISRFGQITPANGGADSVVCGPTANVTLTALSAASGTNGETQKWTNVAGVSLGTSQALGLTGLGVGVHKYAYVISNAQCPASVDTVSVTVVAPPVAVITDPTGTPKLKNISVDNYQLASQALPATGYQGTWTIKTGQGAIGLTSGNLTGLTDFETNPATGVGTTEVYWKVTDNTGKCPAAKDSATIIKRNITIPNLGPDTVTCQLSLPFTRHTNTGDILPGIETVTWLPNNTFIQGDDIVIPAGTAPGVYTFMLKIHNNVALSDNYDTLKVTVDQMVSAALDPAVPNPRTTCAKSLSLPGRFNPNTVTTATGTWKVAATSTDAADIVSPHDTTSLLNNIPSPGTIDLYWVVQNGTCPKDSVKFTVKQVGSITTPKVSIDGGIYSNMDITGGTADTLCVGVAYTLSSSGPKTAKGETASWATLTPGTTGITATGPDTTKVVTPTGTGTTVLTWTINPDPLIPGCTPESTKVSLVVHDVPMGGTIDGNASVCEGTDTLYSINPLSTSDLPVTYTWSTGAAPQGATLTGPATGTSTFYRFQSDAAGSVTSGSLASTPSNRCGAGTLLTKSVTIKLAPRNFVAAPNDTIDGPKAFCASSTAVKYKLDDLQPDTDPQGYKWYWNGTLVAGEMDTSAIVPQPSNWSGTASSTATVRVELYNACSDSAAKVGITAPFREETVQIIAPDALTVSLVSDKTGNDFCGPQDAVLFTAATSTTLPGGVAVTYHFYQNSVSPSNEFSSTTSSPAQATAIQGSLNSVSGLDTVYVQFIADPGQCLTVTDPRDSVIMEEYDYPDSTVTALGDTVICDDNPAGVTLMVPSGTKNNNGIAWYKDNVLQPQFTDYSITLHSPAESGVYRAQVNSKVCVHVGRDSARVRIYDKPDPSFTRPDPLLIFYSADSVPMPFGSTGTIDTVKGVEYTGDSYNWLNRKDTLYPIIKTTKDEVEVTYTVTMFAGITTCRGQASITIRNTLPLLIPNAFSPNGDGKNETWVIDGLGRYPDTKVKVYNRWGSAMYTDNYGYRTPWDGTHNGALLATGTYYYVIELKGSPDGKDELQTGSLTIVR